MASLKDDKVNFDKLETSVRSAMDAENLYWLQNDAKFRAVKQKGSYEEFKDIVAAAHLKPLAKNDKIQLEEKIVSPWNTSTNSLPVPEMGAPNISQDASLPSSSNEFILQWRKVKELEARTAYLNRIFLADGGPQHIAVIFKNELPFGLLGEFVDTIAANCTSFNAETLKTFLHCMTETGRFSLSLTFLSCKEKDSLKTIFHYLTSCGASCNDLETLYNV